jgi:hypothetical protein
MTSPLPDGLDPATRGQIEAVLGVAREIHPAASLGAWSRDGGAAPDGGMRAGA